MNAAFYSRYGKIIFALAMIAIGVIHIVTKNFPTGLEPVPIDLPARQLLVYVVGLGLIASGIMLFFEKLGKHASALMGVIWLMLLGLSHWSVRPVPRRYRHHHIPMNLPSGQYRSP